MARFKEEAERIDTSLFTGNVSCFLAETLFGRYVVLSIDIRCFYEKNFSRLFENLSGGISLSEAEKIAEEKRVQREKETAERNARWEKEAAERKKKDAEEKAIFLAENPLPEDFVKTENYQPQIGDIYAFLSSGWSGKPEWKIFKAKKHGGRLLAKPCNIDGEENGKGHVISAKFVGTYYVKRIKVEKKENKTVNLKISQISDKAFILTGETYPHRAKIKNLGGVWNKFRQGWIFATKHESAVRQAFAI